MYSKFRSFQNSHNFIVNPHSTAYGAYRGSRTCTSNSSHKKIDSHNIKIFEKPRQTPKILSRNDRLDLFLEGGNFSQVKKPQFKYQQDRNDKSYYKMVRLKKKSEILQSLRGQLQLEDRQAQNYTSEDSKKQVNHYLSQNEKSFKNQSFIQTNFITKQQIMKSPNLKKSEPNRISKSDISQQTKKASNISTKLTKKHDETRIQLKTLHEKGFSVRNNVSSDLQINKTQKLKKPLFYLDAKQFSNIKADSFIIAEYPSGQVIFGNYYKKAGQIASLTKIMTFYSVYQLAETYNKNISQQVVEIDEQAEQMSGTSAQIFVGDTYTVEQLLYGLMLPSGNDAATALAKWGGSLLQANNPEYKPQGQGSEVKSFVKFMNAMAKKCGMKASKFCNPHGLPHPQSTSNAEDMAALMFQCLQIGKFREVIATKKYSCWVDHKGSRHEVIWENTNKLLRRKHFLGGKTGVTVTAGPCLISCYELDDKILTTVVLRTNKLSRRFKQTRLLLALSLSKMDKNLHKDRIKELLRNDPQLDSDNSEDEQQFNYERNDQKEFAKRNKILAFEM